MGTTKLPRRTMSMSKRMVGKGKGKARSEPESVERPPIDASNYLLAWVALITGIVVVVGLMRLIFVFPVSDDAPDTFRELGSAIVIQRVVPTPIAKPSPTMPLGLVRSLPPVIVDVACPGDTVEISQGSRVADTVCIIGQVVEPMPTPTIHAPTVGGTTVPNSLQCTEDSVIGFVGIPDTLVCIHIDNLP